MTTLTPKGTVLLERLRGAFAELAELEKDAPGDVRAISQVIVGHIRSWKPQALLPMTLEPKP